MRHHFILAAICVFAFATSAEARPFKPDGAQLWAEKVDFLWISAQMEGSPIKNIGRGCNGAAMELGRKYQSIPD